MQVTELEDAEAGEIGGKIGYGNFHFLDAKVRTPIRCAVADDDEGRGNGYLAGIDDQLPPFRLMLSGDAAGGESREKEEYDGRTRAETPQKCHDFRAVHLAPSQNGGHGSSEAGVIRQRA